MPTIPSKRKQIVGGGVGMKGIVSALAMNPTEDGILAAGTFTRNIALYGSRGSGELIGTFSIAKSEADRHIGGKGITQLLWSPCGRYLYVAERKSQGMLVYDVRVTGQLLGWLQGRRAVSNQRLKADIIATGENGSHEIWAGGTDGITRVWKDPFATVGQKETDWEWKVHDGKFAFYNHFNCIAWVFRVLTVFETLSPVRFYIQAAAFWRPVLVRNITLTTTQLMKRVIFQQNLWMRAITA
jgi:hypothetical protein